MKFYSSGSTPRPVRLPAGVREWAWESMHGRYGDEAMKNWALPMDGVAGFEQMDTTEKYDAAVREIAQKAPVRICPQELVAGSATLGLAVLHQVPVTLGGKPALEGISHLTIRYDRTLHEGVDAYAREIEERLRDPSLDPGQTEFLHSLQNTVESMRLWHGRYLAAVKETRPEIYANLRQVPFGPARSFYEAVQALWFEFAFVRSCGGWPGIGRIDWLLGDYLKKDLAAGVLTRERAREILASLFIKGCEWIQSHTPPGSGDAQHYQNIVLAGVDENGREVTNEVTYLVLDIVEELAISDFPITVRLNTRSPEKLLRRTAQVMRHGGGILAVYGEETVLKALEAEGYAPSEARRFANDGCWEVQVPGRTCFGYMPFDGLQLFDRALGIEKDCPVPACRDAEEAYGLFREKLEETVRGLYRTVVTDVYHCAGGRWQLRQKGSPHSAVSLFEDGCIPNAASYYDLGPVYTVRSPHLGGAPDIANSLLAIQKLVFEQKKVSFGELVGLLRDNWAGREDLRLYAKNKLTYYGNDSDEADRWEARVLNDFAAMVHACEKEHPGCPVKFIPGISTFGRNVEWLPLRNAAAFGYHKGDILAGNDSPTPGTDFAGATSVIRSYCKAELSAQTCGAALDLRIFPETLRGEEGLVGLKSLLRGFVRLGGFFLQPDCVDAETLRAAQADPEAYKTLSVRISGWNARFVTLQKDWQEMIIERTQHTL